MPYTIQCPSCEETFEVGENLLGKLVRCRHCQATMQIPALAPPPDFPFQSDGPEMGADSTPYARRQKKQPTGVSPAMAILMGGMLGGLLVVGGFLVWKLTR